MERVLGKMRRMILVLVVAMLMAMLMATTAPSAQAHTGHQSGQGYICNSSSVTIWGVANQLGGGNWRTISVSPGACSRSNDDVDAIWGKSCSSSVPGRCWYHTYKLGHGDFSVTNGYISPTPPGRVLTIRRTSWGWGNCWCNDSQWDRYRPSLNTIGYGLRT